MCRRWCCSCCKEVIRVNTRRTYEDCVVCTSRCTLLMLVIVGLILFGFSVSDLIGAYQKTSANPVLGGLSYLSSVQTNEPSKSSFFSDSIEKVTGIVKEIPAYVTPIANATANGISNAVAFGKMTSSLITSKIQENYEALMPTMNQTSNSLRSGLG